MDNKPTETGLIKFTFATTSLPPTLKIGYESVKVRPYIPLPLRCHNCHRLGYITKACKSPKLCSNCSSVDHTTEKEECSNNKFCINCRNDVSDEHNHSPIDKSCPPFIKQKEITAIKVTEKVDFKEAIKIYHSRHIHKPTSYEKIAANQKTTSTKDQNNENSANHKTRHQQRPIRNYDDILSDELEPSTSRTATHRRPVTECESGTKTWRSTELMPTSKRSPKKTSQNQTVS